MSLFLPDRGRIQVSINSQEDTSRKLAGLECEPGLTPKLCLEALCFTAPQNPTLGFANKGH